MCISLVILSYNATKQPYSSRALITSLHVLDHDSEPGFEHLSSVNSMMGSLCVVREPMNVYVNVGRVIILFFQCQKIVCILHNAYIYTIYYDSCNQPTPEVDPDVPTNEPICGRQYNLISCVV